MNHWQKLSNFFEHGDLTPFAVVISIAHYVPVLQAHGENLIVAALVGTLIDLLHFRTIRKAVNDLSKLDGFIAAVTTFMATAYHWRYYAGDWLLALPIPIGIAILAYHAADGGKQSESAIVGKLSAELHQLTAANNELIAANRKLTSRVNVLSAAPRVLLDVLLDFAKHGKFNGSAAKYGISATDQKRIEAIVSRSEAK